MYVPTWNEITVHRKEKNLTLFQFLHGKKASSLKEKVNLQHEKMIFVLLHGQPWLCDAIM
jgi:hypothetical protein